MKKNIIFLFLICLGLVFSLLSLMIPKKEKVITTMQTYSLSRSEEDLVLPYKIEQEMIETFLSEPKSQVIDPGVYPENGVSWLIGLTDEGSPKMQYETHETIYNAQGEAVSRFLIPYSTWIKEESPKTYSYGAPVEIGSYFVSARATSYGVDCVGCGGEDGFGGTAVGIQMSLTSVRQSDGTWKEGITYDGYYLIATDKNIPFCTIVEISKHRWNGKGLVAGESFQALVVDRGGAIKNSNIDLFTGSEANSGVTNGTRRGVHVEIIGFGKRTRNSLGERICQVTK